MTPPIVLEAAGFRVTFDLSRSPGGDRFGHRIEFVDGNETVTLLESIEGTSDDAWPASPPIQEVHVEDRDGGMQVALAVGRAGSGHWSLSCHIDAAAEQVVFDVACRFRAAPPAELPAPGQPGGLGSAYRCLLPLSQQADGNVQITTEMGFFAIDAEGRPVETGEGLLAVSGEPRRESLPETVAWKYVVRRVS